MGNRRLTKFNTAKARNILFVVLVLILFTVFFFHRNAAPVTYQFEDDAMLLIGPEDAPFSVRLPYAQILSVSLASSPDLGVEMTQSSTRSCLNGTWESDTYGRYSLYGWAKVSEYIVIETGDGFILCNFESNDATEHLCTALQELLLQKNGEA